MPIHDSVNILVDTLPAYVEQNKLPLLRKVILEGNTIQRFTKQFGIKTSAAINYLSADPEFQDGSDCGFTPQDTVELTQRIIDTGMIKINETFCPKTLLGKYAEYLVKISAVEGQAAMPFEEFIFDLFIKKIREKLEKAVFQGDKSLLGAPGYLKRFDGLLKLARNERDTILVDIPEGASAFDAIKAVYMAIPEEKLENVAIFVSPSFYRSYVMDMVAKNYYHYSGPQNSAPEELVFPGTNTRVVKALGLGGTNKIYVANPEDIYYGTDIEGAAEAIDFWFSKDDRLFKLAIEFNAGVQTAFPDEVVVGTLAGTPVAEGGGFAEISKHLASIAGSQETVAKGVNGIKDNTSDDGTLGTGLDGIADAIDPGDEAGK